MPTLAAQLNIINYWIIGLPIGTALCYWKTRDLASIWAGLAIAVVLSAASMTYVVMK